MIKSVLLTTLFTVFISLSSPASSITNEDPEAIFKEAMQLRDSGQIDTSIHHFESLLNLQPGLNRARLELAVAYHMAKRYKDARDQLYKVLNDPTTPDNVRLTITGYLAQLGADEKKSKQRTTDAIYIAAGIFSDSNVNIAPTDNINLEPGSKEKDATGSTLLLNYSHHSKSLNPLSENPVLNLSWNSAFTAYSKMHTGPENDYNLHVLSINTGPQLDSNDTWTLALDLKIDKIFFDDNPYADYLSIHPKLTLHFENDLNLLIENRSTVREFTNPGESGLEGISKLYGVSISKIFSSSNSGLELGTRYHSNGADDNQLNYNGIEVLLSGYIQPWDNGKTFLKLSSRDYEYKISRDEHENKATLGISHTFTGSTLKSWTLNAQAAYTENDSNIDLYNYERTVLEINLERSF